MDLITSKDIQAELKVTDKTARRIIKDIAEHYDIKIIIKKPLSIPKKYFYQYFGIKRA
jgi:DNA-binding transcriptional regulator WhiA